VAYGYKIGTLPITTIQRLPSYLRVVREMQQRGRDVVSSARLAELLKLEAIQVRKDFGYLGITGRPKTGYLVELESRRRCDLGGRGPSGESPHGLSRFCQPRPCAARCL
jgi:Putative DNA-binding protein N-terminus